MTTDNWPVDLKYYSRRLTQQIVDQDAAARPRVLRKFTFGLPATGMTAELGRSEIDRTNPFDMVRRATAAVTDNTGTLTSPGNYVRAALDLSWNAVPVFMGWDRVAPVSVACFFADVEIDEIGRVFVGLFGSASNFLGRAEPEYSGGWVPSEAEGLYQILDDTTEPGDPQVASHWLSSDGELTTRARIVSARTLFDLVPLPGQGKMDVLLKPYVVERDVDLWHNKPRPNSSGQRELVVLGTPVWVATVEPQPDQLQRTSLPPHLRR